MKNEFFEALRIQRHAQRLSQSELAERAGVHRNTIAVIERGDARNIKMDTLSNICAALGFHLQVSAVPAVVSPDGPERESAGLTSEQFSEFNKKYVAEILKKAEKSHLR